MKGLLQVVTHASVTVDNKKIAGIDRGILALIGIEKTDTEKEASKLLDRILNYRIFDDAQGKMNLSLKDIEGGLLLVPQFTLVAETQKGTRPGFSVGMPPDQAKSLFTALLAAALQQYGHVASGEFGAYMQVELCNDGPVTFLLSA